MFSLGSLRRMAIVALWFGGAILCASGFVFAEDVPRLTIATKRFGGVQLMTVGVDGSNPTQLTNDSDDASQPTWCPDGKQIAYVAGPRLQGKIKIMNADGTNTHLLLPTINNAQRTPQWSPDGKQIAFAMLEPKNSNFNIFVVNVDGTGLKNLTDEKRFSADPGWSPDGKRIAFATDNPGSLVRLWVMDADGSNQTDVLNRDLWVAVYPSFSRDGKQIVYGSSTANTPCQVMQVNLDGNGDTPMTTGPQGHSYAEWSPDGNLLAYATDPGEYAGDLCVYDVVAGEHRTVLTGEVFQELHRDAATFMGAGEEAGGSSGVIDQKTNSKMSRGRKTLMVFGAALVGLVLVGVMLNRFIFSSQGVFERLSGLDLPASASILDHSTVETGPFGVDTYQCIRVKADAQTIERWALMAPWKRGPVVGHYLLAENTIPQSILDSNRVLYKLENQQNGRRGVLSVLDKESGEAWLLCW